MLEGQDQLLYPLPVGILENFISDSEQSLSMNANNSYLMVIKTMAENLKRLTCIDRLVQRCAIILGTFFGVLPDFWVNFSATPGFLRIIFWYNLISLRIMLISGY